MKLLKYIPSEARLEFNKEEFGWIPEFMELYRAKKTTTGDYRGDMKKLVTIELAMIWWCNDTASPGVLNGLTGKSLLQEAKETFRAPIDWKPDSLYKAAEAAFKRYNRNIAKETYTELLASFGTVGNYITLMREQMDTQLRERKNSALLTNEQLLVIRNMISELLSLSAQLPKTIAALNEAEKLVENEETKDILKSRGGEIIPSSADPETSL